MPGVSSHTTNIKYSNNNNNNNKRLRRHITRSPITSLLASLTTSRGGGGYSSFPPFTSSTRFKDMRKKMATGLHQTTQESLLISNELEPVCSMTTEWVDVIFFHQGSQMVDPLRVQGTWRKDTLGVSIMPDWQPPSPTTTTTSTSGCGLTTRNPRTLLQTPLVRTRFAYLSDSQGDTTEEEEEEEFYDDSNDRDYCPKRTSSYSVRTSTSHYVPPPVAVPSPPTHPSPRLPPPPTTSTTSSSSSTNNSYYLNNKTASLFTPSSPLASCNIKSLLTSSKFKLLPKSIQLKLLSRLPSSDQQHYKQDTTNNSLDSILNNEYISASLREWQERLLMGSLHRKRTRNNDQIPQWKELFYEDYWGESKRQKTSNTQLFYTTPTPHTLHQSLVHNTIFKSHESCDPKATPPAPLPVQLPLHAYSVHCSSQQILQEHSYCSKKELQTLTLIIGSSCSCKSLPLLVCKICHCIYHAVCVGGVEPKCPSCI